MASGAAALVYETVWLRQLSLVMGHTVYALSAMLTAFLGGLALGAWLAGRWTRGRAATLRIYAGLELGIAASALLMGPLIRALGPVFGAAYRGMGESFVAYNLVQFGACGLLLLVPTVLMGATLPIVTALLLTPGRDVGSGSGRLYAANSIGGALGVAAAGFVLLPALGMTWTTVVAALCNAGVATAAIALARREAAVGDSEAAAPGAAAGKAAPRPSLERAAAEGWVPPPAGLLIVAYALSGFASLALEVGWARIVSLSIGSTTYGFTIILLTFIVGLAAGSWLLPRFRVARDNPVRAIFVLHAVIALWSLLTLSYLGALPVRIVGAVGEAGITFGSLLVTQTFLVGMTIVVPTLAMGGMFPLVTELVHARVGGSGQAVGTTYAANTVGNIVGSFVAGFVLVPRIGMRATIVLAALASMVAALLYLLPGLRSGKRPVLALAAGLVAAVGLSAGLAPAWDREVITSGPYLYGGPILSRARKIGGPDAVERAMRERFTELVDYREGATTVVTVKRGANGTLHLQVGGKSDAYNFASTQNLIAHLALLLHGGAKDVLVVGLGSGGTLGSVLKHPVEHADCVEISPEVRDMARKHFSTFTGGSVDNPRAHVLIGDGRNHVRHSGREYDVVISQPSNPWVSGSASLFTLEYFQEVRSHLRPGGVACSWFKMLDDDDSATRSVIRSWQEVFPETYLFETRSFGEYAIVGLRDGGGLSPANVEAGLALADVAADCQKVGVRTAADVLGSVLLAPEGARAYSASGHPNTDDNAFVEFMGPRLVGSQRKIEIFAELSSHRPQPGTSLNLEGQSETEIQDLKEQLTAIAAARSFSLAARKLEATAGRTAEWSELVRKGQALYREESYLASVAAKTGASDD